MSEDATAKAAAAVAHGPIRVLCSRPGFRRAGREHPAEASYPAGTFTVAEFEALGAEPLLAVVAAEAEPASKAARPKAGG